MYYRRETICGLDSLAFYTMERPYSGYESYQYLDADDDYAEFNFPDGFRAAGEPYEVPLDLHEEERAESLAADHPVVSLHEHPVYFPEDITETLDYVGGGRMWTAYDGLAQSPLNAVFDNMMDGVAAITSKKGWKFRDVVYDLGMRLSDIAHQDFVIQGKTVEDIHKANEEDRLAIVPTLESSMPIENEVDRIDVLHGLGVRMMGITYSESNALGTGLKEDFQGGLTALGHDAVERMNKVGMAIDVSHSSNQTTLDVAEASDAPVFLSHNGSYELLDDDRLDPNECLKAVAETGGVIGIQAAPHNTATLKNNPRHTIDAVFEHFQHIEQLVGIDHVTFGPDTLYGDHVGLHELFFAGVRDELERVDHVQGMENPTETWNNIPRRLVAEGYSDDEIAKVLGGNTLRALDDVWP